MEYELVVIGGGTAGLAAARTGRRAGRRVLLIQDGPVGGDCTFTGCVPSKTLIHAAAAGLSYTQATERVAAVVSRIAATESAEVLRAEGIEVCAGRAVFRSADTLEVAGRPITAERIVVAVGTSPIVPAALATTRPLTTDTIWELPQMPASLAIVGGGAVGCELAQAMARLGCAVTLIEAADRLLPVEEPDASAVVRTALERDAVAVRVGATVTGAAGSDVVLAGGERIPVERVLVAVGRAPIIGDLGLVAAGIAVDGRGFVVTDDHLRTTSSSAYAAGDITGRMPFTHAADAMGRLAAHNAFSKVPRRFSTDAIPWVTFTDPEVARVGLSETKAAARGGHVAYLPMQEVDRAITAGRTEGFIKIIAGPRKGTGNVGGGRVLGATIVAERAGEMIGELALAMRTGMFTGRLAQTTHAYPTYSVGIQQAVAQFFTPTGGRSARPARSTV